MTHKDVKDLRNQKKTSSEDFYFKHKKNLNDQKNMISFDTSKQIKAHHLAIVVSNI